MQRLAAVGGLLTVTSACRPDSGLVVVKVLSDDTAAAGVPASEETAAPTWADNVPPEVSVALGPTPAFTDDTLVATVEVEDADGDPLSMVYGWSVNGSAVATTTDRLESAAFARGDVVEVIVEVSDGTDTTAATDGTVIENSPPTAAAVAIEPASPLAVDTLRCGVSLDASDLDGDAISYTAAWTVDGLPHTGATTTTIQGDTVAAGATAEGELWTCSITASDGTADGPAAEASATIGDDGAVSILVLAGDDASGASHVTDAELRSDFISFSGVPPTIVHASIAPDTLAGYDGHDIVIVSEDASDATASVIGTTFDAASAQAMRDFWLAGGHVYFAREAGSDAIMSELYWSITGTADDWTGLTSVAESTIIEANPGTLFEGTTRALLETGGGTSDLGNPLLAAPFVNVFNLPVHTPTVAVVVYVCASDGSGLLVIDGDRGTPWYSAPAESVDPATGTFGPAVGDVMAGGPLWSRLADCADSDGDGIQNGVEGFTADGDGDGTPDYLDRD